MTNFTPSIINCHLLKLVPYVVRVPQVIMIILHISALPVSALHLRDLPDTNHDHVGRHLQRGWHQQPGWLHRGAHGAGGGTRRAARGSRETWTHGGPSVCEQRIHHHQEEEEPACSQHHSEHACDWQVLQNDFPRILHLLQPYLLVCLLLKVRTEAREMLTHRDSVNAFFSQNGTLLGWSKRVALAWLYPYLWWWQTISFKALGTNRWFSL